MGLAAAYQLLVRRPNLRVAVLDKEATVGAHQSSHNSGVLHSGVYYQPGSLKARLCVEGKRALETFAERHGIAFERCGKLIVAVDESELGRLAVLHDRALGNGVVDVVELGPEALRDIEPHAAGIRALHVPSTGIINFGQVAQAYAQEVTDRGGDVLLGRRVTALAGGDREQVVVTDQGDIASARVITCAGLYADQRGFGPAGQSRSQQVVPFRGSYHLLRPDARHFVRGLIYPVPDPTLPFLGVHFTRRIDGEVLVGPNAVLSLSREGYRRTSVNVREAAETLSYPGFWRLARRYWRTGLNEVWRDLVTSSYVKELQRYVPEITAADLAPGPSGVRAQVVKADGRMVDDFSLVEGGQVIQVRNAPSPAATASLAIGAHLAELAIQCFGLAGPSGKD